MERRFGTVSRGVRCPIIREGDDLVKIVAGTVVEAARSENIAFRDRDIVCVTESILARAQGNYASISAIATDIKAKLGGKTVGVIFPILSRNRFAICLKGIARGAEKIVLMLSYPSDEVGNELVSLDKIDAAGINPYSDVLSLAEYRKHFGENKHQFTGVDYVAYYEEIIKGEGADCEIVFANHPEVILKYTENVLTCDVHSRKRTKEILQKNGAKRVANLEDILTESLDGGGFNARYGLLGSNKATEETIKLFPRDCQKFVDALQAEMQKQTGKNIEVLVYGDGAFKDPVGHIWEFADPVVAPGFSKGLEGTPNELKLKYLADNEFAELQGEELKEAILEKIKEKQGSLVGEMAAQGTTPRRLTDLIGSLCDLTSGSGDKGTPVVWIQGYFDNYTN